MERSRHLSSIERRTVVTRMAAAAVVATCSRQPLFAAAHGTVERFYDKSVVIDALAMPTAGNVPWPPPGRPLTADQIRAIRTSGLTAVNVTVGDHKQTFAETMASIRYWDDQVGEHPRLLSRVGSALDILSAKRRNTLGLIYGTQDTTMLERDVAKVALLGNAGIRIIQLTYNEQNDVGSGCLVKDPGGLTPFGRDVVEALYRQRMVLDLSHASSPTADEAARLCRAPPVISHTGCRALSPHPRNATDETLRRIADKGGVTGIYFMPYLGGAPGAVTVEILLHHIEHALNVSGEDHVGIGSDLSISPIVEDADYRRVSGEILTERRRKGISAPGEERPLYIPALNSARRLELVALALSKRGHGERTIEKVIGGNFQRVFGEVWKPVTPSA